MIKAQFSEEANIEMKGDLAEIMAECVCGTISMLDAIASVNAAAANEVRNELIKALAGYKPNLANVQAVEKDVQ